MPDAELPGPRHLYVHVPFCTDRCTYCAFATMRDDPSLHGALVESLLLEIDRARPLLGAAELQTLYLGGGTPSVLAPRHLEELLAGLDRAVSRRPDAEVTLEANPQDIDGDRLGIWHQLGINRLSVGIQTFDDTTLATLGRHHRRRGSTASLAAVAEGWAGSWSTDLLVGWLHQTSAHLETDLETLLAFSPPHVSVYALMVERATPLATRASRGEQVRVADSKLDDFDAIWSSRLRNAGFDRYEVANFAQPGHRSRHNLAYWALRDFLGIGPGAHSAVYPFRWFNTHSTSFYMESLSSFRSPRAWAERVSGLQHLHELLAVGLRTSRGVEEITLKSSFGQSCVDALEKVSVHLREAGFLRKEHGRLVVPSSQLVKADRIALELIHALGDEVLPVVGTRRS